MLLLVLALLIAPAPAPTAPAPPPAAAYDAARADADLELLLHERGKAYLEARARLEASPQIVAPQVAARLRRSPAPTPAEERRLLALLAAVARPEDLEMFAEQLRREVAASKSMTQGAGDELRVAEPWRTLLREQGAAAVAALKGLVAERSFTEDLRALLLADLVAVTPTEALTELVALVGAGSPGLRQALRQALARRAASSPRERADLLAAVDGAVASSEGSRKASLIGLRAGLGEGADADFTRAMIGAAEDEAAAFAVRVAALRVLLARAAEATVQASLERIAARHLEPARQAVQASEVLGALALQGLRAEAGRALVERLALTAAAAPRIAAAAYGLAALANDGAWLDASQAHPWPEVRGAALARVEGPCAPALLKKIVRIADATRRNSEAEAIVAREAITAIGRCGGEDSRKALERLLDAGDQDPDRRAEAARQLIKHHGSAGAELVGAALARTAAPSLSIRLIKALQRSEPPPSPGVREALCEATEAAETAAAARQAIAALIPDETAPCGERAAPTRPDPERPALERE
ncbi:MAG: hypothetical protein JNL82_05200 [Myxococcales bacterium]|nr:hypothetical protein [Myxococcales bacterium]